MEYAAFIPWDNQRHPETRQLIIRAAPETLLCPDCHHEFLLAFSCRGRWFCPSCHAIVTDGLFRRSGVFHVHAQDRYHPTGRAVPGQGAMLEKESLIDKAFIVMIMKWRHTSGFTWIIPFV